MNEVEISDDELEVEVQEEAENQEGASTGDGVGHSEEATAGTSDEEPDGKKPSKFQRRIDDLVHKQREAERQRDEYYKVAQKVMDENNRLRTEAKDLSSTSVSEMEARIEADIEKAKADYKSAYEDGDADRIIDAQDRMLKASSQTSKLEAMRTRAAPENYEELAPIAPPPDSKAVEWAGRNSWFNQDKVMTNAAYAIHDEVIQQGITPDHDGYYEAIDRRMREEFPHKFAGGTTDGRSSKNVATVVTPGGNESGRSKKVRLSPSQVAVAKRLGVPLEEYAKQFVALEK